MSSFKPARRTLSRLRLALTGPSGSGKTYSALLLAQGLGGKVAVIDTEHGSASLYSDVVRFDTMHLSAPFSPERYIDAIREAEELGYDVLIVDSITHEWNGKGGVLEIHDKVTRSTAKGNSYIAWADVTPRHNAFIEALLQSKLHVIVTMRSKQDFVLVERGGRSVPQKVGLAPIQRDGMEYEFTAVLDLGLDGNMALASKDRTRLFTGRTPAPLSVADGERLRKWLESAEPEQAPPPAPREREPGEDDEPVPAVASTDPQQPSVDDYVASVIEVVEGTDDLREIAQLRDDVKALCQRENASEAYAKFVAAMKRRVAAIQAANAEQQEAA